MRRTLYFLFLLFLLFMAGYGDMEWKQLTNLNLCIHVEWWHAIHLCPELLFRIERKTNDVDCDSVVYGISIYYVCMRILEWDLDTVLYCSRGWSACKRRCRNEIWTNHAALLLHISLTVETFLGKTANSCKRGKSAEKKDECKKEK